MEFKLNTASIKKETVNSLKYIKTFILLSAMSVIVGLVIGLVGFVFHHLLETVTVIREENPFIIYFLPIAGLAIVFLYKICKREDCKGTNLILLAVRSEDEIPIIMAPLIFISTALTHLFGGSAGREGAALQLGGSIAQQLGRWFKLDEKGMRIITMCGMSACFSALFGTPIAAAVFSMEVISVGVMYYSALLPCVISALIGTSVSQFFGASPTAFSVTGIPSMNIPDVLKIVLLGGCCALVSILFCRTLHASSKIYKKLFKNQYICIAVGGIAVVLLTLLFGTRDYLGAGVGIIDRAIGQGTVRPEAFLLKILFTAVTLGAGYKGGEIVPSFFVGATFGCFFGGLIGLNPSFAGALGLLAVFCGVTNCPLATLLIGFELFGFEGAPFYLLIVAVSYMLSGYYGLYSQQKIMYSKFKPELINITCK